MSVNLNLFDAGTVEQSTNQIAAHAPDGLAWNGKYVDGTNIRGLLRGMAVPYNAFENIVETVAQEFNVNSTSDLIEEWEESVGLPDQCFGQQTDIDLRKFDVISRLRKQPIVTLAEMQELVDAKFPDANITLTTGSEFYTFEYEFEATLLGDIDEKFVIVGLVPSVEPFFEYDFEVDLTGGVNVEALECMMRKIIPSNVIFIVEEVTENA